MRDERAQGGELIYEPGDIFLDSDGIMHILADVETGESPSGRVCEEYTAKCRKWVPDYTYTGKLPEFLKPGDERIVTWKDKCAVCFSQNNPNNIACE